MLIFLYLQNIFIASNSKENFGSKYYFLKYAQTNKNTGKNSTKNLKLHIKKCINFISTRTINLYEHVGNQQQAKPPTPVESNKKPQF